MALAIPFFIELLLYSLSSRFIVRGMILLLCFFKAFKYSTPKILLELFKILESFLVLPKYFDKTSL